ncbi:hypothetical protein DFH08DRAFT_847026 [Mycena albidolilacea]|uniref:Uncharacterized protein n=1 Tax=Mycena albidolilacea TaxID=1033008 RepID=A0AAD7AIN6_9AGAR|nr:hypothetical protein DFH08DRAFT_847026 [Mycena albidolilacea]
MNWIRIGGDFVAPASAPTPRPTRASSAAGTHVTTTGAGGGRRPEVEGAVHLRLHLLVARSLSLSVPSLASRSLSPLTFSGALHRPVALPLRLRLRPLQHPDLLLQPRIRKAQLQQPVLPAPACRRVEALENVVARSHCCLSCFCASTGSRG